MKTSFTFLLLLPIYCLFGQSFHQENSNLNSDFLSFKEKLETAINRKDTSLLKPLLYKRIQTAFDAYDCSGGCTPNEVIALYFTDNNRNDSWEQLSLIYKGGFYSEVDTFKYSWIQEPRDPISYKGPAYLKQINNSNNYNLVIINNQAVIREQPNHQSKIIAQKSEKFYKAEEDEIGNIVFYNSQNEDWVKLILENGKTGFILVSSTSASIARGLTILKFKGSWKIARFESNYVF